LFSGEEADGDLGRLPALLDEAWQMGLLADPAPGAPGHELGTWGRACLEEGLAHSLGTLAALGEVDAGFAACVHGQGLGALAWGEGGGLDPHTPLAAAFTPSYGVPLSDRPDLPGSGLYLREDAGALLEGTSHFLLAAHPPGYVVCFVQRARSEGAELTWCVVRLDARTPGVTLSPLGRRIGLRAAQQYHLRCENVSVSPDTLLYEGQAALDWLGRVVACDWLGQTAIALGVARRALQDSFDYTSSRYQGGVLIEEHATVQLLQGTAAYDIGVLEALLERHAARGLLEQELVPMLRWAAQARLALVEHAHRAVTDCLQTLGGYGYMEDYGFEKRLRDVSTLKSLHGAPDQITLFLNQMEGGGL
jgi:alkylation response protein AidB-like acyl-CoA dehydrogenase